MYLAVVVHICLNFAPFRRMLNVVVLQMATVVCVMLRLRLDLAWNSWWRLILFCTQTIATLTCHSIATVISASLWLLNSRSLCFLLKNLTFFYIYGLGLVKRMQPQKYSCNLNSYALIVLFRLPVFTVGLLLMTSSATASSSRGVLLPFDTAEV